MAIAISPTSDQKVLTSGRNLPVLERAYSLKELKAELVAVARTRKVIMGSVWTIAIAVMVYGMINVTPFLIEHGVNPWIAPGLPLMVDVGLAASIWGDKLVRRYGVKDGWITTLRWGTALMTWALNIARPLAGVHGAAEWTPDWIGVMVHSCGPIMLILVTEAANSFGSKTTTIVQTLAKAERDESLIQEERTNMITELEAQKQTDEETIAELKEQLEELSGGSQVFLDRINIAEGKSNRLLELLTGSASSVQTNALMGGSIIEHFNQVMQSSPGQPILGEEETTGNSKSDGWGKRLILCRVSGDTIFLADSKNTVVERVLAEAPTVEEGIASIPMSRLIPILDFNVGEELGAILREQGALRKEERLSIIRSIGDGSASDIPKPILSRVIIRSVLGSGKV